VEQGKKNQQISFAGWIPREASRLFAKALELGIEVPYVLEFIRKWQLKPLVDGPVPENWPWRVKIRTFGKLAVEVDGKPLEKHRKAPHRLLELLAAIIAFGGYEVPVSRVIDAMWPEVDGDTAHENFKKSLARLRKLLEVDDVIHWQDGKISLNQDLCWVDAVVFDQQATQADGRAIALYTGPFLGHDEVPAWAVSRRERMHATYVSLVNHRKGGQADQDQPSDLDSPATVTQTSKPTPSIDTE
jgi:two-component SAPR family response regulator